MSNYTSVNNIIDTQVLKLTNIQSVLQLLSLQKCQPETLLKLSKQFDLKRIITKYNHLKDAITKQKHLCSDIKALQVQLKEVNKRLEVADAIVLQHGLTGEIPLSDAEPLNVVCVEPLQTSSSSYEYTPVIENSYKYDLKPKSLQIRLLEIEHCTEEEYKLIPKYMVRRMNLNTINLFVDLFNEALSKKYQLISKPKSKLKGHDLYMFREYKAQETAATKGKYFVRELDIAALQGKTVLDKQSLNILIILRHTKRISENREGRLVDYVLL